MMERRAAIVARILAERERQQDLPGSEWDTRNGPNDWCAIASHYLTDQVRKGRRIPMKDDYEQALVKAAAIIIAALEHSDDMARDSRLMTEWSRG